MPADILLQASSFVAKQEARYVSAASRKDTDLADAPLRVHRALRALGFPRLSYSLLETPNDYYSRSLAARRAVLGAASEDHLCKSLVYKNCKLGGGGAEGEEFYLVVVQYSHEVDDERMRSMMRRHLETACELRFATPEESLRVTGFEFNAVAPVGTARKVPIIVAEEITRLVPPEIFLGMCHTLALRVEIIMFINEYLYIYLFWVVQCVFLLCQVLCIV